jgi:hypothetical protein
MFSGIRSANLASTSFSPGKLSGSGTSGIATWWSKLDSSRWNEAAMVRMVSPCWMAMTRLVVKLAPSR